nr:hypothetical protein Itr_chr12CG03090 [Ipomoea trifida]
MHGGHAPQLPFHFPPHATLLLHSLITAASLNLLHLTAFPLELQHLVAHLLHLLLHLFFDPPRSRCCFFVFFLHLHHPPIRALRPVGNGVSQFQLSYEQNLHHESQWQPLVLCSVLTGLGGHLVAIEHAADLLPLGFSLYMPSELPLVSVETEADSSASDTNVLAFMSVSREASARNSSMSSATAIKPEISELVCFPILSSNPSLHSTLAPNAIADCSISISDLQEISPFSSVFNVLTERCSHEFQWNLALPPRTRPKPIFFSITTIYLDRFAKKAGIIECLSDEGLCTGIDQPNLNSLLQNILRGLEGSNGFVPAWYDVMLEVDKRPFEEIVGPVILSHPEESPPANVTDYPEDSLSALQPL